MIKVIPAEVDIGPVEFELPEWWVSNDEMILVEQIEDNLGAIELLNGHVLEMEVEGLLPDRIVGCPAHLGGNKLTGVFFF